MKKPTIVENFKITFSSYVDGLEKGEDIMQGYMLTNEVKIEILKQPSESLKQSELFVYFVENNSN